MRILNYGSLNIDYVYRVNHLVEGGETITSSNLSIGAGGKGLNQSIALAKAGLPIWHAGQVGPDGEMLIDTLVDAGVGVEYVKMGDVPSGNALIQVDARGENAIILFAGANRSLSEVDITQVIDEFSSGDILLVQNEVSNLEVIIRQAKKNGMKVVLNPAPMTSDVLELPLELIDYLILNEVEGAQMAGVNKPEGIIDTIYKQNPRMKIVLTLGGSGVMYKDASEEFHLKPSGDIAVVDTTAAGDTFIGYFIQGVTTKLGNQSAVRQAMNASELCISRNGAAKSIPSIDDLLA